MGVALGLTALTTIFYGVVVAMPGDSRELPLPAPSDAERLARERMEPDLRELAQGIGERNLRKPRGLRRAAELIERELRAAGYRPTRQSYDVDGVTVSNIEATLAGNSRETVVIGAHYDSAIDCPGANDNGTGVVALLELARRLQGAQPERTLRFVFFVNEEPPYFNTDQMGSRVYADALAAQGVRVVGMLSLETMGSFSDEPNSQRYPPGIGMFYPDRASFIAFVGDVDSRALVRDAVESFREVATIPSEGTAAPSKIRGVDWSDHASFWRHGWPALMVTDTAPFRYAHYHLESDTVDKVDFDSLARVVVGLEHVIRHLAHE